MPPRLFSILCSARNSTELRVNVFLPPFGNPALAVCFVAEGAIRASAQTRVGAAFFALFRGGFSGLPCATFQPFSAYSDGLLGNFCLPVSGFSTLFIGEKGIIFIIIFSFLKKSLKY
jgi:hypothetical protein